MAFLSDILFWCIVDHIDASFNIDSEATGPVRARPPAGPRGPQPRS